jgi:tetratricopeptide (TPR) repeat protein/predicted Ser/Thr protein kinase
MYAIRRQPMLERIGEYEVRFEIGRGGFGRVYLGYDPRVGRLVAIKVIDKAADLSLVGRFRAEANAAGNLRHKNIVTIYGYGEDDGQAYLVMEYLEGRDLYQIIDKNVPLTMLEKVSIVAQIADGLSCAHKNGVIHRDVKPGNVMVLADGAVKIMDFGIARLLREGAARLTQGSDLIGTVSYMAPEQFANAEVDALCDIWAFGVMFYELLTGLHPFIEKNPAAIMFKITNLDPPPIADCTPALERIVMKLLSRDRENRYQTMEDVQFELAPVLRELQKIRATTLVAEATVLLQEERLDDANALIISIIELDPANEEARRLRGEIQERRRQRTLRPRVAALLRQAEIEVAKRNFPAAIRAADSALRLDPEDSVIQNYRSDLLRAWEGAEAALQLTHQARHQLELADLTGAFQIVTNALRADPGSSDAQRLLDQIREEMEAREELARLRDQLNRAEVFLAVGALHEAGAFVNQLAAEHPDSIEVAELQERLIRQKAEAALRERLQSEISVCQNLLRTGELVEASVRLESLSREYPQEDQPRDLLAFARQELQTRERVRFCAQLEQQVWSHVEKKRFQEAQEIIEKGLETYPSEPRLHELLRAIVGSKSEYEKAQHLEDQLRRCRELRDQGQLDEARAVLDVLRGDYGEEPRLVVQREEIHAFILERARARAIETVVERADTLLRENQPDAAVQLLHRIIVENGGENGDNARLLSLLAEATAAQEKAEKQRHLESLVERAAEYESSLEWDAALALIKQGIEMHGEVENLCQSRDRIENRQKIQTAVKGIESSISKQDWANARSILARAEGEHPGEQVWRELGGRARVGEIQEKIEESLAQKDLERARDLIAEARQSPIRITRLDVFETELHSAEFRRASLDQAQALSSSGDYAQADVILGGLLERRPSDSEVISARKQVHERREELERASRRQAARDEAGNLLNGQLFEGAIRVLKRLLKDIGPDAEVEEELRFATAEKQRFLAETNLAKGRQEAGALVAGGEFEAAVRKYRALLDQYPENAELAREATSAAAAWQGETRKQGMMRERDRALELIKERKYDAALRLLQPLVQEFRDDRSLEDAWRMAMTERASRSDWLEIYEQISEIEELYRRGKAEKVKERALRLLAYVEEPRVRQMLGWAEGQIALKPSRRVFFSMPRTADWPAILIGPAALAILVIWVFATRRFR